jgi:hypothetical protein
MKLFKKLQVVIILLFVSTRAMASASLEKTEVPWIGMSAGSFLPVGTNVKNAFNMGASFNYTTELPVTPEIGAGVILSVFKVPAKNRDDLSGGAVIFYGSRDFSVFMPEKMILGLELGAGFYVLNRGGNYNGTGLNGSVVYGYDLEEYVENLKVVMKIGGYEILKGFYKDAGGTMEWLDIRLGFEYRLFF